MLVFDMGALAREGALDALSVRDCKFLYMCTDQTSHHIYVMHVVLGTVQVRELWLSSEDTGAYGRDLGTSLPQLLTALTGVLGEVPPAPDGGPRVIMRLGMTNPPFILEHLQAVAEVCHT